MKDTVQRQVFSKRLIKRYHKLRKSEKNFEHVCLRFYFLKTCYWIYPS